MQAVKTLSSHTDWIAAIAWHPQSAHHLVTASHDSTVKLWDTRAAVPLHTITGHTDKVITVRSPRNMPSTARVCSDHCCWGCIWKRQHSRSPADSHHSHHTHFLGHFAALSLVLCWGTSGDASALDTLQVLAVAWAGPQLVASGGADGKLRLHDVQLPPS